MDLTASAVAIQAEVSVQGQMSTSRSSRGASLLLGGAMDKHSHPRHIAHR
jgi:hypothetical protein